MTHMDSKMVANDVKQFNWELSIYIYIYICIWHSDQCRKRIEEEFGNIGEGKAISNKFQEKNETSRE